MKSITHTINGFTSSLLLNVGLTKIAEKFDPVAIGQTKVSGASGAQATMTCLPCNYTPSRNR